jgi:hypothetical protein
MRCWAAGTPRSSPRAVLEPYRPSPDLSGCHAAQAGTNPRKLRRQDRGQAAQEPRQPSQCSSPSIIAANWTNPNAGQSKNNKSCSTLHLAHANPERGSGAINDASATRSQGSITAGISLSVCEPQGLCSLSRRGSGAATSSTSRSPAGSRGWPGFGRSRTEQKSRPGGRPSCRPGS